ncbi:hypothetical protein C8J57DRAFT_15429 [Mycena rebaudengoi]|nr:hypothetical protein C8J57DRAFT_15429 [Mycena rebaudengoi]
MLSVVVGACSPWKGRRCRKCMGSFQSRQNRATGTRDASRLLWVFSLGIERVPYSLDLRDSAACQLGSAQTLQVNCPFTFTRLILSCLSAPCHWSVCLHCLPLSRDSFVVLRATKARTRHWWPEPSWLFPLEFDCLQAGESPNPGAVSDEFRAPWATSSSSTVVLCDDLQAALEVRPRSVGERIEILMATRALRLRVSGWERRTRTLKARTREHRSLVPVILFLCEDAVVTATLWDGSVSHFNGTLIWLFSALVVSFAPIFGPSITRRSTTC